RGGYLGCPPSPPVCDTGVASGDNCDGVFDVTCTPGVLVVGGCHRRHSFPRRRSCERLNDASADVTYTWKEDLIDPVLANLPMGGDRECTPPPPICDTGANASDHCDSVLRVTCTREEIVVHGCYRSQRSIYRADGTYPT